MVVSTPAIERIPNRNGSGRTRLAEPFLYLFAAGLSLAAVTVMIRLWRAIWTIPFAYSGDAIGAASMVKTTLGTGWYESQPLLGAPTGQVFHDFPFADDLHLVLIRGLGLFTHDWPVVFNLYYVLGYPLAAMTGLWFLRRCGLGRWLAIVLAVLFAVAPYHLLRHEGHYFLSGYYALPLGLVLVLSVIRHESLWGVRDVPGRTAVARLRSTLTGRGAGTVLILVVLTYSGAYYAVFTGLLLAAAALFALIAAHDWRRFGGAVLAGGTLGGAMAVAAAPDWIYSRVHGANTASYLRAPGDSEKLALKFVSLVLPADGHPIPAFRALRAFYDHTYPFRGEQPALGLLAAAGFLILLGWPLARVVGAGGTATSRRAELIAALSVLTWAGFLIGTVGGIGTLVSFLSADIRGWNRISIALTLFGLAGLGLALESVHSRFAARRIRRHRPVRRFVMPLTAAALLLVGVFDQSSSRGAEYAATAAAYRADAAFVESVQAAVPAGSMIFQTPVIAFPEGGYLYRAVDSDQLIGFLHSDSLRWSGGGLKGRPQSDWTPRIAALPPAQLTRDLAVLGFAGIVVDRFATPDRGSKLEAGLRPEIGGPMFTGSGGRYAFFSLAAARARVDASMTAAQQQVMAREIVPPAAT